MEMMRPVVGLASPQPRLLIGVGSDVFNITCTYLEREEQTMLYT